MDKMPIPLKGYVNNNGSPIEKVGTLEVCSNWLKWKGMLKQPPCPTQYGGNAANAHSAIFHRDNNAAGWLIYTNGRDILKIDDSNNANVVTIAANQFASNNLTNLQWPVDRFYKHIFFGTDHDGLHFYYPDGYGNNYVGKAGVAAPANAATATTGNVGGMTGQYELVYTYVNERGHESAPSPASNSTCTADHTIVWGNIAAGPTGTVSRKLYRTVNDGALFLYLTTLNDNTTTTYEDGNDDSSLGAEVDFEGSDAPPTVIRGMAVAGSRLYLLDNSSKIWASKVDTQTSLPNWEAYPSNLATQIPAGESSDQVQDIFTLNEIVFAATRNRVFKLVGDPYTGTQVVKVANVGLFSRRSWCYVDSDRRYVYMLTSNYKIVRMDSEGNWQEMGQDILGALQGISNYKAPDLGDSVDITLDSNLGLILLHCAVSGYNNNTTLILDLSRGEWSQVDWPYMFSLMDDTELKFFGYVKGTGFKYHDASKFLNGAAYYTTQTVTTYPFFLPDRLMTVGRIGIVGRGLPSVGGVPPMLLVEYAVDNNEQWKGEYVSFSRDGRTLAARQVSQELVTAFLPVHRTVQSLSVRLTAPQNAAAVQGFEIYEIYLEIEEAEETHESNRRAERDKE